MERSKKALVIIIGHRRIRVVHFPSTRILFLLSSGISRLLCRFRGFFLRLLRGCWVVRRRPQTIIFRPAIGPKLGVGSPASGSKLPSLLIALKQENVCKADERRTHARRELLRVLGFNSPSHGIWKSQKKYHSKLRAKRALFISWVDKSSLKMPK